MNVTQVEYRKLKSGHNFSNETVGATAVVPDGHDPAEVLDELRIYVDR